MAAISMVDVPTQRPGRFSQRQPGCFSAPMMFTGAATPLLSEAMSDRIHQPYRASLIPGFEEILALKTPGMYGIALSGAGPTIYSRPGHACWPAGFDS